jgi:hypothetical protein
LKKMRVLNILFVSFIILGMINPVWAASLSRSPIEAMAIDDYLADWYNLLYGETDEIFIPEAPNGWGLEYVEEACGWGCCKMDVLWYFVDIPTDGDDYYLMFYVDKAGEWMKVYYWYNSQWSLLGYVFGPGSHSFKISTPQSSSPIFLFEDYLRVFDFGESTWEIGWPVIRVYS